MGNELFRQMVNQKKRLYLNSCKRDKPSVSRGIVQSIRNLNPPGRFLQRDEQTGLWYDIGDQKAREKTSQALREGAPDIRKTIGGGSGSGGSAANIPQGHPQWTSSSESLSHAGATGSQPPPLSAPDIWGVTSKPPNLGSSSRASSYSSMRGHTAHDAAFRQLPDIPPTQSGLSSHFGPDSTQALVQFLKAQQAKAAAAAADNNIMDVDRAALEARASNAAASRTLRDTFAGVGAPSPARASAIAGKRDTSPRWDKRNKIERHRLQINLLPQPGLVHRPLLSRCNWQPRREKFQPWKKKGNEHEWPVDESESRICMLGMHYVLRQLLGGTDRR